jgi:hypothetical protein
MTGSAIANNTITNSDGISDTASSGVICESSVAIISKMMVGMNQIDIPKINQ